MAELQDIYKLACLFVMVVSFVVCCVRHLEVLLHSSLIKIIKQMQSTYFDVEIDALCYDTNREICVILFYIYIYCPKAFFLTV